MKFLFPFDRERCRIKIIKQLEFSRSCKGYFPSISVKCRYSDKFFLLGHSKNFSNFLSHVIPLRRKLMCFHFSDESLKLKLNIPVNKNSGNGLIIQVIHFSLPKSRAASFKYTRALPNAFKTFLEGFLYFLYKVMQICTLKLFQGCTCALTNKGLDYYRISNAFCRK